MDFRIEQASMIHLSEIMEVMEDASRCVEKKEWFVADEEDYVSKVLEKRGFVVGAWEAESGEMAGFFMVYYPDAGENLGIYAGLTGSRLENVVYLDSTAVKADFRGNHLQDRMLKKAEELLMEKQKQAGQAVQYRMCTVHPQNSYSLNNMQKNGYSVVTRTNLYGGLDRYVLCKKSQVE